ncbi:MAG TPA: hypothetical protein VFI02_13265, partial [Armatimonadota bacterium]|nr:hypothetical protein [Armatimonadota bacterium]
MEILQRNRILKRHTRESLLKVHTGYMAVRPVGVHSVAFDKVGEFPTALLAKRLSLMGGYPLPDFLYAVHHVHLSKLAMLEVVPASPIRERL